MNPADYAAMLTLNTKMGGKLKPALVEHAKRCELSTDECPTCHAFSMKFKKRLLRPRGPDGPLEEELLQHALRGECSRRELQWWVDRGVTRAEVLLWCLDARYKILETLWIWEWIDHRPKWR